MAEAKSEAADLTLAIENKFDVPLPLPAPEANGAEVTAAGEDGAKVGGEDVAEDKEAGGGGAGEGVAEGKEADGGGGGGEGDGEDGEGPTDEELALLERGLHLLWSGHLP